MRQTLFGVGTILVVTLCGCSGDDTAPGSKISRPEGGTGGAAGEAGSLSLGIAGGGAGSGGGGGAAGASAGSSGGVTQGGTSTGGTVSHAGTSAGGSGGTKPMGICKRSAGSDADCADFYPPGDGNKPQAYACDDTGAYFTLNTAHASQCASVNFVSGAKYGACCPP